MHLLWVLITPSDRLSVMSRCNNKSWRHHKFRTACRMHMHTLTPHILALHIKFNSTCCYKEVDGEGSCNNTSVPWNCLLPVITHSCLKGDWHICGDSDLSVLNTVAFFQMELEGSKRPNVSRQCHDESVSTFRPRSYAGHSSSAHKSLTCLPQRYHRSMCKWSWLTR